MTRRVLVPIDGSDLADRILVQVRRLLHRADCEVILFTVVGVTPTPSSPDGAEAHLEDLRAGLAREGVTAVTRVAVGEPVAEILRAVRDDDVQLVAMATHGRSGLRRVIRGSVAEQVLRRSPVPVLTANPGALDRSGDAELHFQRLLVPLDLSDAARTVLPLVEELAVLFGSEVILLTVDTIPPVPGLGERAPSNTPARLQDALLPDAQRLREQGIHARSVVAYGAVASTILDVAQREQADLVALTTHGRHGVARAVFGSTAEELLRTCNVPLLVRRVAPVGARARS